MSDKEQTTIRLPAELLEQLRQEAQEVDFAQIFAEALDANKPQIMAALSNIVAVLKDEVKTAVLDELRTADFIKGFAKGNKTQQNLKTFKA